MDETGRTTKIAWTDHTWNPWQGCHKVSTGCDNCYMEREKTRFGADPFTVVRSANGSFYKPNRIKVASSVFVCSWSDFFIEEADAWRDEAWEVIRKNPHLTFQLLTKRPENIIERLPDFFKDIKHRVWIGATAENQEMANKRMRSLCGIYSPNLFLSIEPMLGPIDLEEAGVYCRHTDGTIQNNVDWIIVGGESGPNARYMEPFWADQVRIQCLFAGIPFFMKQMSGKGKNQRENIPKYLRVRERPENNHE